MHLELSQQTNRYISASVADLDQGPGSSAFLTPGSGIEKILNPGKPSRIIFGLKILTFFVADLVPGSGIRCLFYPGSEIQDPGSWILDGKIWIPLDLGQTSRIRNTDFCMPYIHALSGVMHTLFLYNEGLAYSGKSCNDACMSAKYCTSPEDIHHHPCFFFTNAF
jgi:hypothetical protein